MEEGEGLGSYEARFAGAYIASIEAEEALASSVFSNLMNNYSPLISRRAPATTMKRQTTFRDHRKQRQSFCACAKPLCIFCLLYCKILATPLGLSHALGLFYYTNRRSINPRRACAARVRVLVCLSVCLLSHISLHE